jgi:hypothetical protein
MVLVSQSGGGVSLACGGRAGEEVVSRTVFDMGGAGGTVGGAGAKVGWPTVESCCVDADGAGEGYVLLALDIKTGGDITAVVIAMLDLVGPVEDPPIPEEGTTVILPEPWS